MLIVANDKEDTTMAERVWDKIDAEMEQQANSIRRMNKENEMVHTCGRGSRTIKCRITHRRQQPASSSVIVAHAQRRTGLWSNPDAVISGL